MVPEGLVKTQNSHGRRCGQSYMISRDLLRTQIHTHLIIHRDSKLFQLYDTNRSLIEIKSLARSLGQRKLPNSPGNSETLK